MATTDTQLQQLVINVGTEAQISSAISGGTITEDMLSITTDGSDITYDWVGTLAEYNALNLATTHPDWLCFITDDVNSSGEDVYNNVYTKAEANDTFVAKVDNLPQYLPNLLEYKYTDHILNDVSWLRADTNSWQDSGIYEAAYNHLEADLENATQKSIYLKHNVTLFGDANVSNRSALTGFRTTVTYAQATGLRTPTTSMELVVKVKMPDTISGHSITETTAAYQGVIIRPTSTTNINIWLSSNGSSWNVMNGKSHTCNIPSASIRWVKLTWDGTTYYFYISEDGINYTLLSTTASTDPINWSQGILSLGGTSWENYPFAEGAIYLADSYVKIDGEYAWKGADFLDYYEAKDGHKIVLSDQANKVEYLYNAHGDAWYYVLDTTNKRFKLPRNKHRKVVESGVERGVWYRLYDDGWVEQGGDFKTFTTTWTGVYLGLPVEMANTNYQVSTTSGHSDHTDSPCAWFKHTHLLYCIAYNNNYQGSWFVSGQSAVKPRTKGGEDYLYFYVGEFTQDAIRNIAGITTEALNEKIDRGEHEVIEFQTPNSNNNYTWYRKYADGWVEQGGVIAATTSVVVQIPVTMKDANYGIQLTCVDKAPSDQNWTCSAKQTTQFTYSNSESFAANWQICGLYA